MEPVYEISSRHVAFLVASDNLLDIFVRYFCSSCLKLAEKRVFDVDETNYSVEEASTSV